MRFRYPGRGALLALLFTCACSSSTPVPPPAAARPVEVPASDPAAVAARISGDWQFAIERGGRLVEGWLHFGYNAGELVGSLTGPDANPTYRQRRDYGPTESVPLIIDGQEVGLIPVVELLP